MFHFLSSASEPGKVILGKTIFFDANLSQPAGQSCASCHQATQGLANKNELVTAGANSKVFGNRNSPSISYSIYTVDWHYNYDDETWMGGFFLDGRAKTMLEQAKGPFLNPVEMANSSPESVVNKIKQGNYRKEFEKVFGLDIWRDSNEAFTAIADALVAYQQSDTFAPRFTSKYDAYLAQTISLSKQEMRGLELYEAEDKGNCAACHPSQVSAQGEAPLFTDFSYDNLGVPKNSRLPFYRMAKTINHLGSDYIDEGLANNPRVKDKQGELGKFKVPTLRNIALTAPYMHNGVFTSLKESIEFYNSRDVDSKWQAPEVEKNVNKDELGDLNLTAQEVDDLVAFLLTLSDGYILNSGSELAIE